MKNELRRRRFSEPFALAVIAFGAGCSSLPSASPIAPGESALGADGDELERVAIRSPGVLSVRPDRPIGADDSFKLSRIDIRFARKRSSAADEERVREPIRAHLVRAMEATGLPIVERPDPCTRLVEVGVTEIELADPISTSGSTTHFVSSWGTATLAQYLFDGETGVPLLRDAVRRKARGGTGSGLTGGRDWSSIEEMLDHMLRDAQTALYAALPIVDAPPQKPGCRGGIYELRKRTG
jgi:hypothetical protein